MENEDLDYKGCLRYLETGEITAEEEEKLRDIHKTIVQLIGDKELLEAVIAHGEPITFAASDRNTVNNRFILNGYRHLVIDPRTGLNIVMRRLNFFKTDITETHNSHYPLYVKDKKVYFDGDEHK
ncbi:MAG: hypothetical protein AABW49_05025, partial [Nanoarchaeota archaeon]